MKSHTLKLFSLIAPLLLSVLLSACGSDNIKTDEQTNADTRPITKKQATLSEEAKSLLEAADDSSTFTEQSRYQIRAASLYIEAGEIQTAKTLLTSIRQSRTPQTSTLELTAGVLLLSAEIAIAEKNTLLANETILQINPVTRDQQIKFYTIKADFDYLSGRYMFAIDRRVQLDTYIIDEKHKHQNYKKIWIALSSFTTQQLHQQSSLNPTIGGWLDLAKVMRKGQQNISSLEDDLLDWGTHHPTHPVSQSFLIELIDDYQFNPNTQRHIAVLLPMEGNFATVSNTIKNGILSAYYNDSASTIKPIIRFYDISNKDVTFLELYEQAIDNGATNIIGPLDKVVINQLAQKRELDIPVLTLNYSENEFSYTENLFQFGLSPEDEARQVAELAIRQNKFRAAVFHPDSEWGKRLFNAFTEHYEFLGGSVLSVQDYAIKTNDYRRPIRALLNLDQSSIRRRKVENIIGEKTQSEAYRRQDIDMIFLAATHHSARGIMPAFKFHHAGDIPVYATSHVYTGKIDRDSDRDLDGLIFCDLPWILQNNSSLSKTFKKNWPQQRSLARLYALGVDAYHLIHNLDYLEDSDYAFYEGQTGNIQLNESNRVTRKLLWAKFHRGRAFHFEPKFIEITETLEPQALNNSIP